MRKVFGLNSNVLALIPSNFPTAPTAKLKRTGEMAVFCGTALRVKARDVEFQTTAANVWY